MKTGQVGQTGSRNYQNAESAPGARFGAPYLRPHALCVLLVIAIAGIPRGSQASDVALGWNANTEPDLAGYVLYIGKSSGQYDAWVDVKNTTSYVVSGLTPGTYYFTLRAYDSYGAQSGRSNEISVTVSTGDNRAPLISAVAATGIGASAVTINWITDEPADAQVEYGLSGSYGMLSAADPSLLTAHTVALGSLTPSSTYHYRVRSRDAAGNLSLSGDFTFTTVAPPDTKPPVITSVMALAVSSTSATITWTSDEPSDTQVEYGLSISYGSNTATDPALVASHSQVISGLSPGTTYHFRVRSRDAAANLAISGDCSFSTTSLPGNNGGLVAAYGFDEGTGFRTADATANANTGVLNNATWTAQARFGTALSFNGKNSFVSAGVAGLPGVNQSKTVMCWLYWTSNRGSAQSVVALANGAQHASVQQGFQGSQVGILQFGDTWLVAASLPSSKSWHHFAYTYDGSSNRLYIDGVLVGSSTISPQTASVTSLEIGRWIAGSKYFKGIIDEVRIYNRALGPEEIRTIMSMPVTGAQPVLSGSPVRMNIVQNDSAAENEVDAGRSLPAAPVVRPSVDIRLSRHVYEPGESVTAESYWISNPSGYDREVEVKTWLAASGQSLAAVGQHGLDGLLTLPAGLDRDFGPVSLFLLGTGFKAGSYQFNARAIDPVTGDILAQDLNPFVVAGEDGTHDRSISARRDPEEVPMSHAEDPVGGPLHGGFMQLEGYRIANDSDQPVTCELKIWLEATAVVPVPLFALGGEGSLVLPAGSELTLDSLDSLLMDKHLASGTYQLRVRALDWATGESLCETTALLQIP